MAKDKIKILEKKLAALRNKPDKVATRRKEVDVLNGLAREYLDSIRDFRRVEGFIRQSLILAKRIDYKSGIALGCQILGNSYFAKRDYGAAKEWHSRALEIFRKIKDQRGVARSYDNLGNIYLHTGDYDRARKHYLRALNINKRLKIRHLMGVNYNHLGRIYDWKGEYARALSYYLKSLDMVRQSGDRISVARCYIDLGVVSQHLADYQRALDYYLKALAVSEKSGNEHLISMCYSNMGGVFYGQKDWNIALKYFKKGLEILKQIHAPQHFTADYYNIGCVYDEQGKLRRALKYKLRALKIAEDTNETRGLIFISSGVARTYYLLGVYDFAQQYCQRSLNIATRTKDKLNMASNHLLIGQVKLKLRDYSSAYDHLCTGLRYARKIKKTDIEVDSYKYLSMLFEAKHEYKKALHYYIKYTDLKQKIFTSEKSKQVAEMRTRYETETKDKEAEIYRLKNVDLRREIRQRKKAEKELEAHRDQLDELVTERTSELKKEIAERKQVEQTLLCNQQQLRSLAREISLIEEKQRRKFAAFLHDDINQALALATFKLRSAQETNPGQNIREELSKVMAIIDKTAERTRTLAFDISPPVLYELGLEPALEWLTRRFGEQYRIKHKFIDDGLQKPITDDASVFLYQSVRELLSNVAKHAQAQTVKVSTIREGTSIRIAVKDDGNGFNPKSLERKIKKNEGFGLFNIRERLRHLRGHVEIQSRKGKGTTVTLIAPLKRTARKSTK